MSNLHDCRVAFSEALLKVAAADDQVVVVCNDSVGSSNLGEFRNRFAKRLFNVGIAEQNMVGVAAGLANGGKTPFVCAASCFLTARALEQIKVDCAYSRANVKLCGMASGLAYGQLGPTHHSIEDIAWMRAIAGLTVIVPADPAETRAMVEAVHALDGPVFLRLSRMGVPNVYKSDQCFRIGKAIRLREGEDVTIVAVGTLVSRALEAAERLESQGISARVVSMATIKPLDHDEILAAAEETKGIVTAEEHTLCGGLGGAVAEVVVSHRPTRMRMLGVPGVYAPTGAAEFLHTYFGLTADGIEAAVHDLLE